MYIYLGIYVHVCEPSKNVNITLGWIRPPNRCSFCVCFRVFPNPLCMWVMPRQVMRALCGMLHEHQWPLPWDQVSHVAGKVAARLS